MGGMRVQSRVYSVYSVLRASSASWSNQRPRAQSRVCATGAKTSTQMTQNDHRPFWPVIFPCTRNDLALHARGTWLRVRLHLQGITIKMMVMDIVAILDRLYTI